MGSSATAIVAYGYVLGSDETGWKLADPESGDWRPCWLDGLPVTEDLLRARLEDMTVEVGGSKLELIHTGYDYSGDLILGFELLSAGYTAVEWAPMADLSRLLEMERWLAAAAERLDLRDGLDRRVWVVSLYG